MDDLPISAARAEAVWELLRRQVVAGRSREVAADAALGQVLAADANSQLDYPPFDRAVMDGFAVRAADFEGQPARLRQIGLARAGESSSAAVERGTCAQINTGAVVPAGADAIVMVED